MAKARQPEQKFPANLSREDMRTAIPKIERRIEELKQFNVEALQEQCDPRIDALEKKLDDTLVDIFGHNTIDYDRYRIRSIDHSPLMIGGISLYEAKQGIKEGFTAAIVKLNSLIETFKEKIQDTPEEPSVRAKRTFSELNIHPELTKGVGKLFQDGHYANAVEDACKILEAFVKMRSMRFDLSGTDLMHTVFSVKTPVIAFNELQTETDKSEQQGMMFLYAGAMLALRNPRAHSLKADDPENALDLILFISLLMKSLDNANKI